MLRSFLVKSSIIIIFIIFCMITTVIALAIYAPLLPGSVFYSLQDFSEQKALFAFPDPEQRANFSLDLFERRINNLAASAGKNNELAAIQALDKVIDQSTTLISLVSQEKTTVIRQRLYSLAQQASNQLALLTSITSQYQSVITAFKSKLRTLISMTGTQDVEISKLR